LSDFPTIRIELMEEFRSFCPDGDRRFQRNLAPSARASSMTMVGILFFWRLDRGTKFDPTGAKAIGVRLLGQNRRAKLLLDERGLVLGSLGVELDVVSPASLFIPQQRPAKIH
jgi:hypothetical protein